MTNNKANRMNVPARQASLAKVMRRDMTEPERKLWKASRWRLPLEGTHFRRQVPLGPYIADFCSHGAKLIVEVDGNQHGEDRAIARDAARTVYLNSLGYRVLRFSNRDVLVAIDSALDTIAAALDETPTPNPSPQGGGESHSCGA
jgi:very-short-patch-repair endonuclease